MKDWLFFDKNFDGLSNEVLDDFDFWDLPLEDVDNDGLEQDWDAQFDLLEEPYLGDLSVQLSELCDQTQNENVKLEKSLSASLAKTAGATHGKTIPIQNVSLKGKDLHQFQTNSPVSVFEGSGSSPSVENSNFELPAIPAKRPRGKRQRLSNNSLLYSIPFSFTSPTFQKCRRISVSKSGQPAGKLLSSIVKKKHRKNDISLLTNKTEMKRSSSQESVAPKKCMHCEVTKTPQWREGPMGPKTLCNACGVRFRSNRLFAEYRPAASPTFVASLHSKDRKSVV